MIKNFEEYINEDYFSKLASRKDTGTVRTENEITEDFVRSFVHDDSEYKIKSITIRKKNGKPIVDVDGTVKLRYDIDEIPFQFGTVTGDFVCSKCENLKTLEGVPEKVGGGFYCIGCENLTSIEGCPEKVGGDFKCSCCYNLTSLEGCPKEVGGDFYCSICYELLSLEGVPEKVGGIFSCSSCEKLTSLEGCPKEVGGDFNCIGCGKQFAENDVKKLCEVKGKIFL